MIYANCTIVKEVKCIKTSMTYILWALCLIATKSIAIFYFLYEDSLPQGAKHKWSCQQCSWLVTEFLGSPYASSV